MHFRVRTKTWNAKKKHHNIYSTYRVVAFERAGDTKLTRPPTTNAREGCQIILKKHKHLSQHLQFLSLYSSSLRYDNDGEWIWARSSSVYFVVSLSYKWCMRAVHWTCLLCAVWICPEGEGGAQESSKKEKLNIGNGRQYLDRTASKILFRFVRSLRSSVRRWWDGCRWVVNLRWSRYTCVWVCGLFLCSLLFHGWISDASKLVEVEFSECHFHNIHPFAFKWIDFFPLRNTTEHFSHSQKTFRTCLNFPLNKIREHILSHTHRQRLARSQKCKLDEFTYSLQ